ncbi:hypothetical protein OG203_45775 [Nocardia sp. NBC_01499]|uniref:hypothetical protein n=1 Tax=Nocardia sp. NBC_01499 TaxID=2903597 RepID=UPI00386CB431
MDLTEHGAAEVRAVTSADPSRFHADTKVDRVGVFIKAGHPCLWSAAEEPDNTVCGGISNSHVTVCGTWQFVVISQVVDLSGAAVLPAGHQVGVVDGKGAYYKSIGPSTIHSVMVSQSGAVVEADFRAQLAS